MIPDESYRRPADQIDEARRCFQDLAGCALAAEPSTHVRSDAPHVLRSEAEFLRRDFGLFVEHGNHLAVADNTGTGNFFDGCRVDFFQRGAVRRRPE